MVAALPVIHRFSKTGAKMGLRASLPLSLTAAALVLGP